MGAAIMGDDRVKVAGPAPGPAPALTPISGMSVWLDYSQGTFQDSGLITPAVLDGDPIGGDLDRGANGFNATQSVNANRGTLKLNQQNGLAVCRGNGTTTVLNFSLSAVDLTKPHTYYWISRVSSVQDGIILWSAATTGLVGLLLRYFNSAGTQKIRWSVEGTVYDNTIVTSTNHFGVFALVVNGIIGSGGTSTLYENGSAFAASASQTPTGHTTTTIEMFGDNQQGVSAFIAGDIGEMIIYNTAHTSAQVTTNTNYFNSKWKGSGF